jgi:hypothetical protein
VNMDYSCSIGGSENRKKVVISTRQTWMLVWHNLMSKRRIHHVPKIVI